MAEERRGSAVQGRHADLPFSMTAVIGFGISTLQGARDDYPTSALLGVALCRGRDAHGRVQRLPPLHQLTDTRTSVWRDYACDAPTEERRLSRVAGFYYRACKITLNDSSRSKGCCIAVLYVITFLRRRSAYQTREKIGDERARFSVG